MRRLFISLLRSSARGTSAEEDERSGERIARYTVFTRVAVSGVFALLIAGSVLALTRPMTAQYFHIGCLVLLGVVLVVGGAVELELTQVRARWSNAELSFTSPWGGARRVRWNELTQVHYSRAAGWFVLRSQDSTVIRVSTLLGGFDDLLAELRRRSNPALESQIDAAFEQWKLTED